MNADELRQRVLYQDSNLIILDKPSGLAVHGGPRTTVHLEGMLAALCFGRREPPQPVHRLDRDTSGCLVLARHDKARSRLGRLFTAGKIEKTYWAVVAGEPAAEQGCIDLPLKKLSDPRGWRVVAAADGRPARTEWCLRGRAAGLAWLELSPKTGRTHQVRVHCASGLGLPILGDPVYGQASAGPLHLLARAIRVPYWAERPAVEAVAAPPGHMEAALRACGWLPEAA